MVYVLKNIKQPDGVNDIQAITHKKSQCFIASFGKMVNIYDAHANMVSSHTLPSFVQRILVHQNAYFLVCSDRYYAYKESSLVNSECFESDLGTIRKILLVQDQFIVFNECTYIIGSVRGNRLVISKTVTDGSFYNICSATVLDDSIILLASTFSNKYLISYTLDKTDSKLRSAKREVLNGDFVFRFRDHMLLTDDKGIWGYKEKMFFIQEFGNPRISAVYSDALRSCIIFCMDGEVIRVEGEYSIQVVGQLDCAIESVCKVDDMYFCGSRDYSYFVRISETIEIIRRIPCSGRTKDLVFHRSMKFVSNKECFEVRKGIPATQSKIEPGELRQVFKTDLVKILTYKSYSVLNGKVFGKVTNLHVNNEVTCFNTADSIFIVGNGLHVFKIPCTVVRYSEERIYIYSSKCISMIDIRTLGVQQLSIDAQVYEIFPWNGEIYLVTFEENLEIAHRSSFEVLEKTPEYYSSIDAYLVDFKDSSDQHCNFLDSCKECIGASSRYFGLHGKVYAFNSGKIDSIKELDSHIFNITDCTEYLVISCTKGTLYYDIQRDSIMKIAIPSFSSFVCGSKLFLCNQSGIIEATISPSQYLCTHTHVEMPNNARIIYSDSRNKVLAYPSIDMKTTLLRLNGSDPILNMGWVETSHCYVRKHLFCVCWTSIANKSSKAVFYRIKSQKLVVRQALALNNIPLSISSYKDVVSIVLPDQILVYRIANNKVSKTSTIPYKDDYISHSLLLSRRRLIINDEDWSFKVVNITDGSIKRYSQLGACIPFVLDKKVGYSMQGSVFFDNMVIEFGECVVCLHVHKGSLFVFGRNGSISMLAKAKLATEDIDYLEQTSKDWTGGYVDYDVMKTKNDSRSLRIAESLGNC